LLGVDQIPTLLAVIIKNTRFHNAVYRAGLFTKAAENTLGEVNIVACRTAGAIFALVRLNGDRHRRANGFAQFTGNATLFAIRVATQRVQATKTVRLWRPFFRILNRNFLGKEIASGQGHAFQHFH